MNGLIRNILLIESESTLANLLYMELKEHGHKVIKVDDGQQAINIIERQPIDILLSDLLVTEVDAFDVVKYIKDNKKKISVIVLSAYNKQDILSKLKKIGVDYFLEKPLDDNQIDLLLNYIEAA